MFDLEKKLNQWRAEIRKRDLDCEQIEELERHLRDSISRAIKSDSPVEEAWKEAISELGNTEDISSEFNKLNGYQRPSRFLVALVFLSLGCFALYGELAGEIIQFLERVTLVQAVGRVFHSTTFEMILEGVNIHALVAFGLVSLYLIIPARRIRLLICCSCIVYTSIATGLYHALDAWHPDMDEPRMEWRFDWMDALWTPIMSMIHLPFWLFSLLFSTVSGEYYDDFFRYLIIGTWNLVWLVLIFRESRFKRKLINFFHRIRAAAAAFREPGF